MFNSVHFIAHFNIQRGMIFSILLDKSCNFRWSTYVELCVIGLRKILMSKKDTFLSPEIGVYKITFYKQKKWNVSTYKALFILIKLNVLLNEINVFLCYTCFKNQFNCWAESLLNEHNFNVFLPGADPDFFLGGAALVVTDWWRSSRRGGGAHPLHPPPISVPAYMCQMSMTLSYYREGSVDVIG